MSSDSEGRGSSYPGSPAAAAVIARSESPRPDESQQFSTVVATENNDFAAILAVFPPVGDWSAETIDSLQSSNLERYPDPNWGADSESGWTQRVTAAILAANRGTYLTTAMLTTCSNTEYFSLSTHTITLLTYLFYNNLLRDARANRDAAVFEPTPNLRPADGQRIGYPIFRVDYTNDEEFALYKACWEKYLEAEFYIPGFMNRADVAWHWVEDREILDGKGSRAVRSYFNRLCQNGTLPSSLHALWICLMVDRQAIESMLRVYGPQTLEIFTLDAPGTEPTEIPYLPYLTAVDTNAQNDDGGSEDHDNDDSEESQSRLPGDDDVDLEYPGYFKCALKGVFRLWEYEQALPPDEYYPRDGSIWGDDEFLYVAPRGS